MTGKIAVWTVIWSQNFQNRNANEQANFTYSKWKWRLLDQANKIGNEKLYATLEKMEPTVTDNKANNKEGVHQRKVFLNNVSTYSMQ